MTFHKIFNAQFSMLNIQFRNLFIWLLTISGCLMNSCTTVDLYEKAVAVPDHEWKSSHKPEFNFVITDTTALYQAFFVIRHTEKYNYNNIWINYYYQPPADTIHKETREFQLATNDKGWLGTGMDDIYEHRIKLTPFANKVKSAGNYKFILENIMREDPLQHVLNVGIRIEKVQ